jgi:hypothetical protein
LTSIAVKSKLCVPTTGGGAAGVTVIPIEGISRLAEADLVASVAEVPVRVTVALLAGAVAGAL